MTTTIKVSDELRDRLKVQAAAAHLTLGEHLARLADLADRQARLAAMQAAMRTTSAEDLADYRAEAAEWLNADLVDAG
jgi:predicted transcriptional regulator